MVSCKLSKGGVMPHTPTPCHTPPPPNPIITTTTGAWSGEGTYQGAAWQGTGYMQGQVSRGPTTWTGSGEFWYGQGTAPGFGTWEGLGGHWSAQGTWDAGNYYGSAFFTGDFVFTPLVGSPIFERTTIYAEPFLYQPLWS